MIDSLSEDELFEPHMRKWADEATKTATWEVYKFIHVNTVAPFGLLNDTEHKVKFYLDEEFMEEPGLVGIHQNENTATLYKWIRKHHLIT